MFMGGEDLRDWARGAEAGTSLCLGIAAAVPASTQPALRSLAEARVIDVARRRLGPDRYSFVVQRRSGPYVDRADFRAASPRPRGGVHARRAGTVERRILKLLMIAAQGDLPCPTNAVIARAVGLRGEAEAKYRVRRLVQRGLIRVDAPADPRQHRVVTIVASGKATRGGAR